MTQKWNYNGFDITVDAGGTFKSRVADDLTVSESSLAAVKQKIDAACKSRKETVALPVVCIVSPCDSSTKGRPTVERCNITGIHRTTAKVQFDLGRKGWEVDDFLPDSEANRKFLEQLIAARLTERALQGELRKRFAPMSENYGYGRIAASDYADKLARLKKEYQEAKSRG